MESEIRELLQEHGVSFKTNSKSFILTCPRCVKSEKLYIRRWDGRFVCWHCAESDNFKGRPEFALRELTGLPLSEVKKKIYGIGGGSNGADFQITIRMGDYYDDDDEIVMAEDKPQEILWNPEFVEITDPLAEPGASYLAKRGIDLAVAAEYKIKYWPGRRRVIFPVMSDGKVYGHQARVIDSSEPFWSEKHKKMMKPLKIITSDDLDRERLVMFADRLKGSDHAIICEGPIDALKAHLCGGNIAAMGKAVSRQQLELIRNSGISKIYLGLDPDAYREVYKIYRMFSGLEVYDLRPPQPYKDLGEMSMEEVKTLFNNAKPLPPGQIFVYMKNHYGEK